MAVPMLMDSSFVCVCVGLSSGPGMVPCNKCDNSLVELCYVI